jgi:hypothetical protein
VLLIEYWNFFKLSCEKRKKILSNNPSEKNFERPELSNKIYENLKTSENELYKETW